MAVLVWDQIGDRIYQTGVDHGVLYLPDGTVAPWNGLVSIEESPNLELKSFYLDGVKFLDNLAPGDFLGKLKAFTYPDEFDSVNGIATPEPGISYYDQPSKSFSLSYRTRIGNNIDGIDFGYKIHILYNIIAIPESHSFDTIQESDIQPVEFSWTLSGTPSKPINLRPTVHISLDSIKTPPDIWTLLESILYGTDTTNPSLPSMENIGEIFGYRDALVIVDHGDGSWSAIDDSDAYINMINATTFEIDNADAIYLDPDTYTISSTSAG